jgi:hypothetical protein
MLKRNDFLKGVSLIISLILCVGMVKSGSNYASIITDNNADNNLNLLDLNRKQFI